MYHSEQIQSSHIKLSQHSSIVVVHMAQPKTPGTCCDNYLLWSQSAFEKSDICDNIQNSHLCPCKYEGVCGIAHSMSDFYYIHRLNETFPLVATTVGTVLLRFLSCGCPELLPQYIYTIANKCVNGVPFLVQNTCFKVELYQMSRYTIFRLGKLVSAKKPCQMAQSRIF